MQPMHARLARAHAAFLAGLTIFFPTTPLGQDALSGEALCGYTPATHVSFLDRNWELYLPYPQDNPYRQVKFGPGLRARIMAHDPCSRAIIAIGSGTITWGAVTIGVGENELTVNGKRVEIKHSVLIDHHGNVTLEGVIPTPE